MIFGATGLTGKLVAEELAKVDELLLSESGERGWAVAGRNREKLEELISSASFGKTEALVADLEDQESLYRLAEHAAVIINMAGPYTPRAENLIQACVDNDCSYVDITGELPLVRRVIEKFHEKAQSSKLSIVQVSGWEAFPADVASFRAASELRGQSAGVTEPLKRVSVLMEVEPPKTKKLTLDQQVSGGTLASIVEILKDPNAAVAGAQEALLPHTPLNLAKAVKVENFAFGGKEYGPVFPLPMLNPPVVRRTAYLLADKSNIAYWPAEYREGSRSDAADSIPKFVSAVVPPVATGLMKLTRLPLIVRAAIAAALEKKLPPAGFGPKGELLKQWKWKVSAVAEDENGRSAAWGMEGEGHPGYIASAAMAVEIALGASRERWQRESLRLHHSRPRARGFIRKLLLSDPAGF